MKERPILFSGPMVRAILEGRKTMTRRVVKLRYGADVVVTNGQVWKPARVDYAGYVDCPYGQVGNRLWVREAWRTVAEADSQAPRDLSAAHRFWYEADVPHQPGYGKLRPSIHMPRIASRILLEVTAVRVERLQDISAEDAIAEGMKAITKDGRLTKFGIPDADGLPGTDDTGWPWHAWRISPIDAYMRLWEQINGPGSWAANPWVWVVEFKRVQP